MKYTKYFYVIIAFLIIIIIGEIIYFFSTDIYPQFTTNLNKTVSPQSNTNKTLITKSNTQYNFNDYESGNYFVYTNDQGIRKLYISLKINGTLKEENGLYILPVSLLDNSINLILGYPERKILFYDAIKEKNMIFNAVPLKEPVNSTSLKDAVYIRVSIPLFEYSDKETLLNDGRCDEACKKTILLIEKQISANQQFLELVSNDHAFLTSKNEINIGPIVDLIVINENE